MWREKISITTQRVFKCGKRGFECDRDLNAATNLKKRSG
ncbi:transposase [Anabaena sp. FACHB-1237]|nr:transposase [Anabaena sp. FACHB-1237]